MPTKRKVTQKQKQKQTTIVNINVAKARGKSSAKKSGKKGGRGSVMMLPPPIYASPTDRLTPAMYGSQGQQIQQRSMEDLLRNFLSNQEKQQANAGFKSLGRAPDELKSTSEFIPYDESTGTSFRSLGSAPGSSKLSYKPNSLRDLRDDVSDITDIDAEWDRFLGREEFHDELRRGILNSRAVGGGTDIPTPFENEERTYLKASEPDYDATAPQFSEKLKPKHSIYDTINQMEEGILKEEDLIKQSRKWLEDSYKNYPIKINKSPFDESSGSNQSLGSFPGMYGPRVPVNKSEQEGYFKEYYD